MDEGLKLKFQMMSDFELHYWYGWLEGYIQACETVGENERIEIAKKDLKDNLKNDLKGKSKGA